MDMKHFAAAACLAMGALLSMSSVSAASTVMQNGLITTGDGLTNPAYGKQIKNLMIFQPAGWVGYAFDDHLDSASPTGFKHRFTWPANGGVDAFLNRTPDIYLKQMEQIRGLATSTAIAALIMPDEEGGMVTCWNGKMVRPAGCSSGTLMTTRQLIPHVKNAAWKKGLQVAPFFSILNFNVPVGTSKGQHTLNKLKSLTDWWMGQLDATAVRTIDGKVVILTESINSGLEPGSSEQLAVINYMNSRKDILWIDNLANVDHNPSLAADNVVRSAAHGNIAVQEWVKKQWGYRYHYHHLNRIAACDLYVDNCVRSISQVQYMDEPQRLKTLNITPHNRDSYPVVISQWNEYSEWLMFEPSQHDGSSEYEYLRWRLSQQP